MAAYGHVGMGPKEANFEMLQNIVAAIEGDRKFLIAIGDYNIPAGDLEASGMLEALGLTVIRPANTDVICPRGKGSLIGYALVTTRFAAAIDSVYTVKVLPWDLNLASG